MDERYTESRLREELRHAVDNVQVPSDMWARIRRRHRREPRQRMLAVATSMALLAIVVAAAFPLVRDAASQPQEQLDAPGPSPSATPVPPGTPAAPPQQWDRSPLGSEAAEPTGPPAVLAAGATAGRGDWTLVAYPMDGGVCYGFMETPDLVPGVGWCEPTAGLEVSQPRFYPGMGSPAFMVGFVNRDASGVQLDHPDGTQERLPRGDHGFHERDGLPVDFYHSLLPPLSQAHPERIEVRALDADSQPPGPQTPTTTTPASTTTTPQPTTTTQSDRPAGMEPATGPTRTVGTGVASGRRWELLAYPYAEGVCAWFSRQPPNWIAAGSWCQATDEIVSGQLPATLRAESGPTLPTFVWGAVSKDAARVWLRWGNGGSVDLRPVGQDAGLDVNFFVFAVLGAQIDDATATVYDANGQELR